MYFSLPGVVATQELPGYGIQLEIEYDVYIKFGPQRYEAMMRETHRKVVEMDKIYTQNKLDYDNL